MSATDLATPAQVMQWLPANTQASDAALLAGLITAASTAILSDLQRPMVLSRTYTDVFDGYGEYRKMLRKWPVTSVTSLVVGNSSVQPSSGSPQVTAGYVLEPWDGTLPGRPQLLDLRYRCYWPGVQNVAATYRAGYLVPTEATVAPAGGGAVPAAQLYGPWAEDAGVTYAATGLPLAAVTPGTALAAGQYSVQAGVYTYAAADAGAALLVAYSYVPAPLNQACVEVVGEAYRYRTRQGERSHTSPGPQTVAFDLSRFTAAVRWMTNPFRMVVPLS